MRGRVARNTIWGIGWQAVRIVFQSTWIFLLARFFTLADFGLFMGLIALATAIGLVSGIGFGQVMSRRVSADAHLFPEYWTKSLVVTALSAAILALLFVGVSVLFSHHESNKLILCAIAVSEIICTPLLALSTLAFQCHERLGWALAFPAIASFIRFASALFYVSTSANATVYGYAPFHLIASIIYALISIETVRRCFPGLSWSQIGWRRREFKDGIKFACLSFTGAGTTELDKPLTLRFGGSDIAAIYSAAARFVSILVVPISTLIMAVQPRLFKDHSQNRALAAQAVVATLIYSFCAVALLQLCAFFLPALLGTNYYDSVTPVRYLAPLVPLYGLRLIATTHLTALEHLKTRIAVEGTGVAILILLSVVLIPSYGVNGAVTATLSGEFSVVVLAWSAVTFGMIRSSSVERARCPK